MSWRDVLARAATSVGAPTAAPALVQFVELFERWNQRINLSAARSLDDIAQHVVDSLALLPHVGEAASLVDVGSGGGFPLIVLGDPDVDRGFDVATSRATFALDEWLALGQQLVRGGGRVLGMEAREQVALGPNDERHPYAAGDRQRAVIVRRVP